MNIFELNEKERIKKQVASIESIVEMRKILNDLYDFLNSYSYHQFDKDYTLHINEDKTFSFSVNFILSSAVKTLLSIDAVLEYANISDAYILARRYREDLFYYLLLQARTSEDIFEASKKNATNKIIDQWVYNKQKDISFNKDVLKTLSLNKQIANFITKYNMKDKMDKINKKLNDFVHWNGVDFYNRYHTHNLQEHLNDLHEILIYLTTSFVYLNAILKPVSIMSSDYIDYLEYYGKTIEELKYEVAPYIHDFLITNESYLGRNVFKDLRQISPMNL